MGVWQPASFSDFARSKRLADGLKDTIQILNSYSVTVGNPPLDGLAGELFGRPVDAKLLAGFDIGRIFVIPARRSLNPSTLGAIEMCPEVISSVGIVSCGGYICELVHFDNVSAAATLKVVATFDAIHSAPQGY